MDGSLAPEAGADSLFEQLRTLRTQLKKRYTAPSKQVNAQELKEGFRKAGEIWLIDLAARESVKSAISADALAGLSVDFELLHQAATHVTTRKRYDSLLKRILDRFQLDVIVPLKRAGRLMPRAQPNPLIRPVATVPTIFVGQSFLAEDAVVCDAIVGTLKAIGFQVFTGEKPKAERISEKVKELIDSQDIFVGIFTRRDKLRGKDEWTTTIWVIEEKTWAMAKGKRLVLLREEGVKNLGGMHADHEFIEFKRTHFGMAIVKLLQMFDVEPRGLR